MSDRKNNFLGIARRTVNTHRQNAYRLLKKLMGASDDQLPRAATVMSNATHTRMIPYPVIEAAVRGFFDKESRAEYSRSVY